MIEVVKVIVIYMIVTGYMEMSKCTMEHVLFN
jgi:hypothetical protein